MTSATMIRISKARECYDRSQSDWGKAYWSNVINKLREKLN